MSKIDHKLVVLILTMVVLLVGDIYQFGYLWGLAMYLAQLTIGTTIVYMSIKES